MRTPSLIAALLLALPAAAAPAVDFDAGVDASAVLAEAKEAAAASHDAVPDKFRRYERDCVTFRFRPDSGLVSEAVWLRSTEWVEECYPTGDPRRGGGHTCHERPGYTHRERVQVTLQERKPLLPWEHDAFEVCLEGPWLDTRQLESAYEYRRVGGGGRDGNILVAAVKKTPMRPDPAGVIGTLASDLTLTFRDRWASYYKDERIVIKVTLKKHVPNWFDPTLLEKEVELPVSDAYAFDLGAEALSSKPEAGKEYYAEYAVKRVGAVSRAVFTKTLESNKAAYAPAAALAAN